MLPRALEVTEVAPRDGLQSLPFVLSVAARASLIRELVACGMTRVEVTSFVNPRYVPQHADAEALCAELVDLRTAGVTLSAYVPNARGLRRALRCEAVAKVGFAIGATDELTLHNTRMTSAEALAEIAPAFADARQAGVEVMGCVSVALGCPFTGPVAPNQVVEMAARVLEAGADTVMLADTIGTGTPAGVRALSERLERDLPDARVAWHFHDTFGMGLANALTAAQLGYREFDASAGGTGGCPFAPGAAGNVASEELVYALREEGRAGGRGSAAGVGDPFEEIDLGDLAAVGRRLRDWVGDRALSKIARVGDLEWRDRFLSSLGSAEAGAGPTPAGPSYS